MKRQRLTDLSRHPVFRLLLLALAVAAIVALLYASRRPAPSASPDTEPLAVERQQMVERQLRARDITDEQVLDAMATVPRHRFVPEEYVQQAHADHPLPIGHGQTISQPYMVALMTQLVAVKPGEKVLEVGTGSGYQAAILAEIGAAVYSVEIIPELASSARQRLDELGYGSITTDVRDGYYGWPEHAPFDVIIVTAAPDHVPPSLVEQLADGGRLVIPVGPPGAYQTLWLVEKNGGEIIRHNMGIVRFVPLTGSH